jgi:hypothetical protein
LLHCAIRVSKNNPAKAYQRAQEMLEWRQREGVDQILTNPSDLAEEQFWRPLLRYELPGVDRKSRPVMIQAIGRWDMRALNKAVRERRQGLLRAHMVVYEMLRRQAQEAASIAGQAGAATASPSASPRTSPCPSPGASPETSAATRAAGSAAVGTEASEASSSIVSSTEGSWCCERSQSLPTLRWVVVLDMEGLSLWHTRYPEVLALLKEAGALGSRYYPETVDRMFVVNAPPGFDMIWRRLLCRFVKPNTRAKVRILPEGDFSDLVAECGASCIPMRLGGQLLQAAAAVSSPTS